MIDRNDAEGSTFALIFRLKRFWIFPVSIWAAIVLLSLMWSLSTLDNQLLQVAFHQARAMFKLIDTTRLWNARHDGVYVPITEKTQPNPYLNNPGRDQVTVEGVRLTQINPAYMTRQISEIAREGNVVFHITSLNPIRPDNQAYEWEVSALKKFEKGAMEWGEMAGETGGAEMGAFRYMAPLEVKKACVQCHAEQEYRAGEVSGGISVTISVEPLMLSTRKQKKNLIALHAFIFLVIAGGASYFISRIEQQCLVLQKIKDEQEITIERRTADLMKTNDQLLGEISERKQAEEKQGQLLKELENVNQELTDFAYIVSHDLKAPLRAINSLAGWILEDYAEKFDEEGRDNMNLLVNRVKRMHSLIDGILQYSRVGRIKEEKTEVNLNLLVRTVMEAIHPPENIEIQIENELPSILCESTRMRQVFQNLLGNAIKYMDKPRGEIKIGCAEEAGCWKFWVKDNGPGIDEKHFPKLFQIFQTLQSKDEVESTGIGLSLVKKILEMYDGKVWVESEVGQGSSFYFMLPQ